MVTPWLYLPRTTVSRKSHKMLYLCGFFKCALSLCFWSELSDLFLTLFLYIYLTCFIGLYQPTMIRWRVLKIPLMQNSGNEYRKWNCLPLTKIIKSFYLNPILHTAWLESHAPTLKNNTAKYYFGEKSSFLHTFLKCSPESRTIQVNFKNILLSVL
jgi:hypothetical protein